MLKLDDLVALARAGWTPKATKEVLSLMNEINETDPQKEVKVEEGEVKVEDKAVEGGEDKKADAPDEGENTPTDDLAELVKLLK